MKYFVALFISSCLFLISCSNNNTSEKSGSREIQIDEFWTWFQNHSDELYEFENNQNQLFSELTSELNKIDQNLTFVFGGSQNDKTRDFIISADGITSSFDAVEQLCDAAPSLEKWNIIPFRPRIGTDLKINFNTIEMDGKRLKFSHIPSGDVIDIKLFIPHYNSSDERYISAAFIMLDNALGEYDVETKLGAIEFLPIPSDTTDLLPFSELPNIVDNYTNR